MVSRSALREAGLPDEVQPYKRTPTFDEQTVPAGLLRDHATKAGVWGVITVVSGSLRYTIDGAETTQRITATSPGIVRPEERHHVTPLEPVQFFVEFYR